MVIENNKILMPRTERYKEDKIDFHQIGYKTACYRSPVVNGIDITRRRRR